MHGSAYLSLEIGRRFRLLRACLKRDDPELYDRTTVPVSLKAQTNAEGRGDETLLYDCVTRTLGAEYFAKKSFERITTTKSSCESLARSADFVPTTPPSRTQRPSR